MDDELRRLIIKVAHDWAVAVNGTVMSRLSNTQWAKMVCSMRELCVILFFLSSCAFSQRSVFFHFVRIPERRSITVLSGCQGRDYLVLATRPAYSKVLSDSEYVIFQSDVNQCLAYLTNEQAPKEGEILCAPEYIGAFFVSFS